MTEPNTIDWQETLTGEMLLFSLLGRIVYTYSKNVERPWLQSLIDEEVLSEVPFAAEKNETKTGLKLLQKWGENGLTDVVFESMQLDYSRLFIGLGKVVAPPWESVYFSEERMTFQQQTLEVRNWYRRFRLESERIHQEPDDHIGLELLFLSQLAHLTRKALSSLSEVLDVNLTKDTAR